VRGDRQRLSADKWQVLSKKKKNSTMAAGALLRANTVSESKLTLTLRFLQVTQPDRDFPFDLRVCGTQPSFAWLRISPLNPIEDIPDVVWESQDKGKTK
jgi:hypothetical protein